MKTDSKRGKFLKAPDVDLAPIPRTRCYKPTCPQAVFNTNNALHVFLSNEFYIRWVFKTAHVLLKHTISVCYTFTYSETAWLWRRLSKLCVDSNQAADTVGSIDGLRDEAGCYTRVNGVSEPKET